MKPVANSPSPHKLPHCPKPARSLDGEVLGPDHEGGTTVALVAAAQTSCGARGFGPRGPARLLPPSAPFLAQLIATAQQAPQTRARRRAEPAHATAIYLAANRRILPRDRQTGWLT